VQVRQQLRRDGGGADARAQRLRRRGVAAVHEHDVVAAAHGGGGLGALQVGRRPAGAEQRHLEAGHTHPGFP